jgi:RNA polymerase sigma factor (sigma-70 family)
LLNERSLVRRILGGDRDAFRIIVEEYGRMVTHIVSRMVRDKSEAEDLAQDVFLKVYENLGGFEFRSKMSTWIGRIAYTTCLNFLEKKRPSLADDDLAEMGGVDTFPSAAPAPDAAAHRAGVAEILEREIGALPVKYRTAVTLFHLHGLSYEEIGEVMGLPGGTVKSHLFRARKQLHDRLASTYSREELEG